MTNRISYFANAWEDTLQGAMNTTELSFAVADAAALTTPCYLVIEPESASNREYVYVESKVGNTLTIATGERYLAGSAAGSGLSHASGAQVRLAPTGQAFEDLHDRVSTHGHTGGTDGTGLAHTALSGVTANQHHNEDHASRHASAGADPVTPAAIGAATSGHTHAGLVTNGDTHDHAGGDGAQIDHGGVAGLADDDHTQYHNAARHDADDHSALVEAVTFSRLGVLPAGSTPGVFRWYPHANITIVNVVAWVTVADTTTVEVDVNKNGTTIFTTQTNRPILLTGNIDTSGTPEVTAVNGPASDYVTVDIDAATDAEDLGVQIRYIRR